MGEAGYPDAVNVNLYSAERKQMAFFFAVTYHFTV
jgi:hypothetical protein